MSNVLIIYWSGTGNTQEMAEGIARGLEEAGETVAIHEVADADASMVDAHAKIAFGCPSMGDEELEEIEFEPFFSEVEKNLADKKVALFGSYDWGDGEWMQNWVERTRDDGAQVMDEGLIMNLEPDESGCVEYGKKFAGF